MEVNRKGRGTMAQVTVTEYTRGIGAHARTTGYTLDVDGLPKTWDRNPITASLSLNVALDTLKAVGVEFVFVSVVQE